MQDYDVNLEKSIDKKHGLPTLVIPHDLPRRKWREMTRREAEQYIFNQIGSILLAIFLVLGGTLAGFLIFSSKVSNSNSLPVQVVSDYYSVTGQMPNPIFIYWYNSKYLFSRPLLSIDQIKTEVNLINKANQPLNGGN